MLSRLGYIWEDFRQKHRRILESPPNPEHTIRTVEGFRGSLRELGEIMDHYITHLENSHRARSRQGLFPLNPALLKDCKQFRKKVRDVFEWVDSLDVYGNLVRVEYKDYWPEPPYTEHTFNVPRELDSFNFDGEDTIFIFRSGYHGNLVYWRNEGSPLVKDFWPKLSAPWTKFWTTAVIIWGIMEYWLWYNNVNEVVRMDFRITVSAFLIGLSYVMGLSQEIVQDMKILVNGIWSGKVFHDALRISNELEGLESLPAPGNYPGLLER
ncbi:hypothetical protein ABW19_dt0208368 [Dactylella cylindrospora]|nr:hypothetical protein ABW19_dt0208368 [Dactylella cylindrospora]